MNDAMKASHSRNGTTRASGLLAAGGLCAVLASPASAVQLGDVAVESALGQPLRASIAFALGPNEQLASDCVYLRSAGLADGLPAITRAAATVTGNRIVLRGVTPLNEPMMTLTLAVDCPYTANLQREYLLMLSPPALVADNRAEPRATTAPRRGVPRPVNVFEPAPASPQEPAARRAEPVAAGRRYRVRVGDTASGVVTRIPDRRMALWPAVDAILAANPQAFVDGDVDRLIAGALLTIPASVAADGPTAAPAAVADSRAASAAQDTAAAVTTRAYGGAREGAPASSAPAATTVEPAAPVAPAETVEPSQPAAAASAPPAIEALESATSRAGRVPDPSPTVTAGDPPATATAPMPAADVAVGIPDTDVLQPANEPMPLGEAAGESSAQNWLVWLGGSGIAIFLGLLLFGRRLRERVGGNAARDDELEATQINQDVFNRRRSDRGEPEPNPGIDIADTLGHADEVPMPQPDFDAFADTGDDVDVALDYSFATSGEYEKPVDFEVGSDAGDNGGIESVGEDDDAVKTREMPARAGRDDETATGNYDMSMVIDATKQDFGTGRRPRDLNAIEVEALDSRPRKGPALDLTTEFDYKILEQDYEEEMTATQALNLDIEKAARELQQRLGEFDDDDDTSHMSLAEDLDGTAEVKADVVTGDATAENQALDDTDIGSMAVTAQLPEADDTVEMATDADEDDDRDETVERQSRAG